MVHAEGFSSAGLLPPTTRDLENPHWGAGARGTGTLCSLTSDRSKPDSAVQTQAVLVRGVGTSTVFPRGGIYIPMGTHLCSTPPCHFMALVTLSEDSMQVGKRASPLLLSLLQPPHGISRLGYGIIGNFI